MGKGEGKRRKELVAGNVGVLDTLRSEARLVDKNLIQASDRKQKKTVEHLQRLAVWAGQAGIHPVAALLGSRLASFQEAEGIPPLDSPYFRCERCETFLLPGSNCSVRIRKHLRNARHKPLAFSKNSNIVVYSCHYCSHENRKPGSYKTHTTARNKDAKKSNLLRTNASSQGNSRNQSLLESKQKNSNNYAKSSAPDNSPSTPRTDQTKSSRKRKRKGWLPLKELVSSQKKQPPSFSNLGISTISPLNLGK